MPEPFRRRGGEVWVGPRGFALAVLLSLVACWPLWASDAVYGYFDTEAYVAQGGTAWKMAGDLLGLTGSGPEAGGGGAAQAAGGAGGSRVARSFIYSAYAFAADALGGPAAMALGQTVLTLFMLVALFPAPGRLRPATLAVGLAVVAAATTLPWFAVYLMPDLLAAAVILYGALLLHRFDALGGWQRLVLGAVAAFAIAAHYGYGPLAGGLYLLVLAWRLSRGRLTAAVTAAAILPILVSPLANLGASSVALDTPSVAPLRLPILLARSIEDGPARRYLARACPGAGYAVCEVFRGRTPDNIASFLWDENGIQRLGPEQMSRVREEETAILWHAFLAYPLAQTRSLFGNAALQVVRVGTGQIRPAARIGGDGSALAERDRDSAARLLTLADRVTPWTTLAGALLLVGLAVARRLPGEIAGAALVVALGLLLNAAIFGGLSAPVDRYQSRIAWLLPALAALALATGRPGARAASAP